eukprot:TRINITY_DN7209_c0_g2_i1.p1 TRINITY_DN7209_c0_g2~~TRINITY_DN7209_c0_g2_i1.p1  ORF type:complete len:193 (+),score=37.22 TRINITY_DN7209_c0_g2_i1:59-580(+)
MAAEGPSVATKKRINKELQWASNKTPDILIFPSETDMLWHVIMSGPKGSLYEGGNWVLSVKFRNNYPFSPPVVKFLTPLLHINADRHGHIDIDILFAAWSPALTVIKVLEVLRGVLEDPGPESPLNAELATRHRSDFKAYQEEVRDHVRQHASASVEQLKLAFNLRDPAVPAP